MRWQVRLSDEAIRELSNLDAQQAQRIITKLSQAAENPQHFLKRLSGQDDFKLRAGDYRIIAVLIHSENVVFVEKIGHRKNIYK